MALYFFLHDAAFFHQQVIPTFAAAWRQRTFAPCRPVAAALRPAIQVFQQRFHTAGEPLLTQSDPGLPFDRDIWRLLVGEVLLYGARDIPDIQTAPETLRCLLAPDSFREGPVLRERFAPIQQAHFGTHDLVFGSGFYRPDQAGWNDRADVARLADYLGNLDPGRWTPADLAPLPGLETEEDRAEEVEYARECFEVLRGLYRAAREQDQVVVCETIS